MKEPHDSLRIDRLSALRMELEVVQFEIMDLKSEERRLQKQLGKAKEQMEYYENFLNSAARTNRGGRGGLADMLDHLRG